MLDPRSQVLSHVTPLTDTLYLSLVSDAVRRVGFHRELTDPDLGQMTLSSAKTIQNARNKNNKLCGHTLFNLLVADPYALEGLLHHFGRRSVPIEAKCDTDALLPTSAAVHKLAEAMSDRSEDRSRVTDRECLEMEGELDAAIEALTALKSRCHTIRKARAA